MQIRNFILKVYSIWISERPALLAAALAYYGMFSFAPVVYIAFLFAGLFIDRFAAEDQLFFQVQNIFGIETTEQIRDLVDAVSTTNRTGSIIISLISFLALFFAASGFFFQMEYTLNRIWKIPHPETGHAKIMLYKRVLSFVMVIGVSLLLVAATFISVVITWFGALISRFIMIGNWHLAISSFTTFVLIAAAFILLYKFLPEVRLSWGDVLPGAIIASLLITFAGWLAALYFKNSPFRTAFQAAGAVAVLLTAIYYIAQIFLLGAVITRVYSSMYGSRRDIGEIGLPDRSNGISLSAIINRFKRS